MTSRVLIANRGEIAVRIIRACRDLELTTIAIYADQDADAEFVRLADEAYALDGMSAAETYLDVDKVLAVARRANATAVHPGYGFLSERTDAAAAIEHAGISWIGPSSEVIARLGDKVAARELAARVGAPLVPGTPGPVGNAREVAAFADEHGLPIVVKAAHGGGGRGMKIVRDRADVTEQFNAAVREATAAFGRGECFVERFLDRPRHVEVQVIADSHGTVHALGTRDCSLQRRNQKLVEEAPAPFLTDDQQSRLTESAVELCRAAGYIGAGTVEYLLADDGTLTFLEVNTRVQVEHAVTEQVTGFDIVEWQLRIARGEALPERAPAISGHAIEFRINAEDAARGFVPTPGTIDVFDAPGGPWVRVDSGAKAGSPVDGAFDSLVAKLIVWGETRDTALARARRALDEFRIEGVTTVLPFHRAVVRDQAFTEAPFAVYTGWIEQEFAGIAPASPAPAAAAPTMIDSWIEIDGRRMRLRAPNLGFAVGAAAAEAAPTAPSDDAAVEAAFQGVLARWLVDDGDQIEEGQAIAVVEAMKMETVIEAPRAGVLTHDVAAGASVNAGQTLGRIEPV